MHINATFADGKVTETDREMFTLPAKEDGASDAVFFHILVRFRRSLANVLNVVSGFVREFIKYISFIRDGSSFVTSLVSKFVEIKIRGRIGHISSHRKDAIWSYEDFADLRGYRNNAIGSKAQTIGSHDHLIVFLIDNSEGRGGASGTWRNLRHCYQTPKVNAHK